MFPLTVQPDLATQLGAWEGTQDHEAMLQVGKAEVQGWEHHILNCVGLSDCNFPPHDLGLAICEACCSAGTSYTGPCPEAGLGGLGASASGVV